MKKFISVILTAATITTLLATTPCVAAQDSSIQISIDGQTDTNYSPTWNEKHDRLLLDAEVFEKYFGVEIIISGNNVDVIKGEHKLHFEAGNEFYTMDEIGGRKMIDTLISIENGKAYLPVRYMCEALGATVNYDMSTQSLNIKKDAIVMDEAIKPYFENVALYDQSTIRIAGDKTVYLDPRRITGEPHDADIILITHTHNDHYEIDSIKKVMNDSTVVYITEDGVEQAKADGLTNVVGVKPNSSYNVDGVEFSTVSAYNASPERQNHKAEFNWVGYIVTLNGYTYYSAGDSDFIEEMKNITTPIDVAFFPIDGKYNMAEAEAAMAANAISPKVAVPYHYNNFVAEDKAIDFVSLLDEDVAGAIITFKMQ